MIKRFLNLDTEWKRISRKQYHKEINDAVSRIETGDFISHKGAKASLRRIFLFS
jgi:hypothetical protein